MILKDFHILGCADSAALTIIIITNQNQINNQQIIAWLKLSCMKWVLVYIGSTAGIVFFLGPGFFRCVTVAPSLRRFPRVP